MNPRVVKLRDERAKNVAKIASLQERNKKIDAGTVGGGGIAMFAAALGLGCVPCGTSLIMPIATLLFSSSAYAAANAASLVVLVIAFILSVYSVYRLGYIAYAHVMSEKVTSGGSKK